MFCVIVTLTILFNWTLFRVVLAEDDLQLQPKFLFSKLQNQNCSLDKPVPTIYPGYSTMGRGHFRRQKKLMQYIYPIIISAIAAKVIIVPLILKVFSMISSSSFIMSKVALVTSGLFLLKWVLNSRGTKEQTKIEIVHLPPRKYNRWNDNDAINLPIGAGVYDSNDFN